MNTKLTLMALFLLQFAYLTQTRHIVSRSTDNVYEDCTAKNVTKNAAACFLSKDFTKRLRGLKISVGFENSRESGVSIKLSNLTYLKTRLDKFVAPISFFEFQPQKYHVHQILYKYLA